MQKNTIFEWNFIPNFFFGNLVLDLIDVYQYLTPLKHSPKNAIHNCSFEIYIQIFKLCDKYYFVTNIFHTFNSLMFIDFFKIID
jgi:hypothetical protein